VVNRRGLSEGLVFYNELEVTDNAVGALTMKRMSTAETCHRSPFKCYNRLDPDRKCMGSTTVL